MVGGSEPVKSLNRCGVEPVEVLNRCGVGATLRSRMSGLGNRGRRAARTDGGGQRTADGRRKREDGRRWSVVGSR